MKGFFVYGLLDPVLVDPDGKPLLRYVGHTTDPAEREYQHVESPTATVTEDTDLGDWIRKLRRQGQKPKFVVMEEYPDETSMYTGEPLMPAQIPFFAMNS